MAVLTVCVVGLCWWMLRSSPEPLSSQMMEPSTQPAAEPAEDVGLEPAQRTPVSRNEPVTRASADAAVSAIFVRLHDSQGRPFQGTWSLQVDDLSAIDTSTARRTLEEKEPSVSIEARPRAMHALCAASGVLASRTLRCQLDASHPTVEVDLTLEPASQITGQVIDDRGLGVAGMHVWLVPSSMVATGSPGQGLSATGPPMPVASVTDAAGVFRVGAVQPGKWNLLALDRESPIARANDIAIEAGDVQLAPLALPHLYSAVVRVVDENGRRVAGAKVRGTGTAGGRIDGVTDAAGELACNDMPAGRWGVHAEDAAGARSPKIAPVDVPAQTERAPIVLTLGARARR